MAAALTKKKTGVSIMDCIEKYCELEQLDESDMWYCNKCKEHVRAWKQVSLYRTPPILIVHLKRFHYSSTTHRRDKIDTLIDFPLSGLDLSGIVKQESGPEPIYDCYAVSNHFGGLGGGHYTAYAKADDGVWRNFDDSRVTSDVNESEVVSSAAYCLFYKRRDVGSHHDSPGNTMVADSLSPRLWEEIDAGSMEVDGGSANTSVCSYRTPSSNLDEDFEMVESQV
jgi:ubiquitin C-terminal hydrolase